MHKFSRWMIPVTALSLCGCSLLKLPSFAGSGTSTSTGASSAAKGTSSGFDPGTLDSVVSSQQMTAVQSSIKSFQQANSSSNFTMPIGNNFTMPIGNNFTMPIGNNFTMPIGNNLTSASALRILSLSEVASTDVRFGFTPIPAGATVSTTIPNALPASSADTTDYMANVAGSTVNGTLNLTWWKDPSNPNASCSYADDLHYTSLMVPVGSSQAALTGDYTLKEAASAFAPATPDAGGTLMLGVNALPTAPQNAGNDATLYHYKQITALSDGNGGSVNLMVDESNFTAFKGPLSNQVVQVPQTAIATGSLTTGSNTLAFDLAASASYSNLAFYIDGTLTSDGGTPITETYQMNLAAGTSTLVYEQPAPAGGFGWKMTMNYDYTTAVTEGISSAGALGGDLWLIDANGNEVSGGKIATIAPDAKGNPVLRYMDGTTVTWNLPQP